MVTPALGLHKAHKCHCHTRGRVPAMLVEALSMFQRQILNREVCETEHFSLLGPKNKSLITVFAEPSNLNVPMYMRFFV